MTNLLEHDPRFWEADGFWRIRIGKLTVYDFDLAEGLGCAMQITRYAREMGR